MEGFAVLSLLLGAAENQQARSARNKQARKQTEQVDLKARIDRAKSRRQARIRKASVLASTTASGAQGSIDAGYIIGVDTQVGSQSDLITSQADLNKEQINLQRKAENRAGDFELAADIADFGMASTRGDFKTT